MVIFGAFNIWVFEGVGGTDYEVEYASAALLAGGIVILIALIVGRWRR